MLEYAGLEERMHLLHPRPVGDDKILWVHTAEYVQMLHVCANHDHGVRFDADTIALPETPEIARLSAGGAVLAVDQVMTGEADNALVVTRPPGHHAIPQRAMGFCFLGNIAIGARYAQKVHGVDRVMIVDYDVHHGNGTQDMFYEDDSVLFISTHQHPFYPGTGRLEETGAGAGRGYTINIPLTAGHGDDDYATIYRDIIWPAARRFRPQLILVSAGFDAHWSDPLAMMMLSLRGLAHLTQELICMAQELCDGKIIFIMEGGYDTQVLAHGMRNVAHALLGDDEISDPLGEHRAFDQDVSELIDQVQALHNL